MNLVIDIGNTFAKTAVVEPNGHILHRETTPDLTRQQLRKILETRPGIRGGILSSTRHPDLETESFLVGHIRNFIRFGPDTPTPLINLYGSPETLGADRLAAAVGAWTEAPGKELLIVDFGSAITIDRVTAAGEYLGGNISPGMGMRFEALHRLTRRLPLLEAPENYTLTGTDTREAIQSGVVAGIVHEIEGYIDRFSQKNRDLTLFFAGRDADFFADKVKKPIFVHCELVIKGLNRIFEYNAQTDN